MINILLFCSTRVNITSLVSIHALWSQLVFKFSPISLVGGLCARDLLHLPKCLTTVLEASPIAGFSNLPLETFIFSNLVDTLGHFLLVIAALGPQKQANFVILRQATVQIISLCWQDIFLTLRELP